MGIGSDWKKHVSKKDAERLLTDPNAGNKKSGQGKGNGGKKS